MTVMAAQSFRVSILSEIDSASELTSPIYQDWGRKNLKLCITTRQHDGKRASPTGGLLRNLIKADNLTRNLVNLTILKHDLLKLISKRTEPIHHYVSKFNGNSPGQNGADKTCYLPPSNSTFFDYLNLLKNRSEKYLYISKP